MTAFLIRPAVADDAAACVAMRGLTRENAIPTEALRERGVTAESWGDDTRRGLAVGHVAFDAAGALVGYAFGSTASGEVLVLALRPEAEGRGLGRTLLGRVLTDLRAVGHRRLFLGASSNPAVRSFGFYRHLGWRPCGERDDAGDELLELLPAAGERATDPLLLDLRASLETPRLLLRVPRAGDGAALHAAVAESLPELRRFLGFLPWLAAEPTLAMSESRCRAGAANFVARSDLPFLCFDKASGLLVGGVGLHRTVWATPKTELGYWVRTSQTGQGFAAEAVAALAGYALGPLGAARVELVTDADNTGSRRVAERCGFVLEGLRRSEQRAPDGTLRDTCLYARLRADG